MIQRTKSGSSRIGRLGLIALVAIGLVCALSGALRAQQQPSDEDQRLAELIKKIEDGMRISTRSAPRAWKRKRPFPVSSTKPAAATSR